MRLLLALLAGAVLAFVAYAFAADITGSVLASVVAAVVGFALGTWGVLALADAGGGDEGRVR